MLVHRRTWWPNILTTPAVCGELCSVTYEAELSLQLANNDASHVVNLRVEEHEKDQRRVI